ncbi:MAG: HAMP domain-containing protein [Rhodomicrobium sp.]|nr:HAMP domain-containing protein [Rhodomicrobium sp.]
MAGVVGSFVLIAGLGAASYTIASALGYQLRQVETLAVTLRNHTVGDMLHDGLRADVYAALFAARFASEKKDAIIAETGEHADEFRSVIEKNRAVKLPDAARSAVDAVEAPLQAYIDSATRIVSAAFADADRAASMLPDFDQRFSALETAMEAAGDRIQEVTEQQSREAHYYEAIALWASSIAGLLGLAVGAALIWVVLRDTLRPLSRLQNAMQMLVTGDHHTAIPYHDQRDEIGLMAKAIEVFRVNASEREKLEEAVRSTRQKERRHQGHLQDKLGEFNMQISKILDALGSETQGLRSTAGTLSKSAGAASQKLEAATLASQEVAHSSQTVASATEELGASIREISGQAQRTRAIVQDAARAAQQTDGDVALLAEGAQRIESVVMLIRSIAEQTNLLALNATIEAARAGESGKGFAVVASEVKQLASQTSKATEDIAHQISDIQAATTTAIESIRAISSKVTEIDNLTNGIAAAVEEQEAATSEIARNVSFSAEASHTASGAVASVTGTAQQTREDAKVVSASSERLNLISGDISTAVNGFMSAVNVDLEERRAALRHTVEKAIVITRQNQRYDVSAFDLSLSGIRVGRCAGLAAGQEVTVDFGAGPVEAHVVWTNASASGLQFKEPLQKLPQLDLEMSGAGIAA